VAQDSKLTYYDKSLRNMDFGISLCVSSQTKFFVHILQITTNFFGVVSTSRDSNLVLSLQFLGQNKKVSSYLTFMVDGFKWVTSSRYCPFKSAVPLLMEFMCAGCQGLCWAGWNPVSWRKLRLRKWRRRRNRRRKKLQPFIDNCTEAAHFFLILNFIRDIDLENF